MKIDFKYIYEANNAKFTLVSADGRRPLDVYFYIFFFQVIVQYGMDLLILCSRHLIK